MSAEIKVPSLGESVTEATVAKWFKQVGDAVAVDDLLVELETDKVTLEVNAPTSGTLEVIAVPEGDVVEVGALLGTITEGAVTSPAANANKEKPAPKAEATKSAPAAQSSGAVASPAARKIASENGLQAKDIPGSGKGGRVTKGDALQAAAKGVPAQNAVVSNGPREERVRMSRLRKRIAERLKESQDTAAILTTFNEIDMTNVIAMRNLYKEGFQKKHDVKLGFMSFFVKASVNALKEIPSVNAEIEGDDIIYKNYYDIGVAVGTPQGLVVPIVRDADKLSFAGIESTITGLGAKARDGKLTMDDMTGGTFTVSNGGVYGSLMSTPIINPPQSGILGMHKTQMRPMVVDGKIEARPMMYIALSYDHRIIDGKEAVTFLVRVKEALEDPQRLLLDV